MSQGDDAMELSGARRVHAIRERFEQVWLAGRRPRIEEYLGSHEGPTRPALLEELLRVELSNRLRTGETPTVEEYLARFPDHGELIAEVLRTGPDDLSAQSLRCAVSPDTTLPFPLEQEIPRPARQAPENLDAIGRFRLERVLGQGGFGTVYEAHDPLLERRVALKVPRFGREREEELLRFLSEAKTAAQLKHPNIVTVFETGRAGSHYYIVSELVEGISLAKHLARERPGFLAAARWVAELAEALQYAHSEGIIHRDVKPANIMLDSVGRTQLTDFGLAKRLSEDATLTVDGTIMGTPAYMAPEQARGEADRIGPHSDQYSLGVVLYELLTGRLPFTAPGMSLLNQIITQDPPRPCSVRREIPRDLEAICLRAMEKDPRHRYAGTGELAADLHRWLEGVPTRARPLIWHQRAWRWACRHPAVATLSSLVAAALVIIVVGSLWFASSLQVKNVEIVKEQKAAEEARIKADERAEAEQKAQLAATREADRATAALKQVETQLARVKAARYAIQLRVAQQHIRQGDYLAAWERLDECMWDNRGWEHDYLVDQITERTKILKGHTGAVVSLAFSPDGRFLATCAPIQQPDGRPAFGLWEVTSGQRLDVPGHDISARFRPAWFEFLPDAKHLLLGSSTYETNNTCLFTIENGKQVFARTWNVYCRALSRDATRWAWRDGGKLIVWDTGKDRVAATIPSPGTLCRPALSPDGATLAAIQGEEREWTLAAWRVDDGKEVYRFTRYRFTPGEDSPRSFSPECLVYSPCGRYLAVIARRRSAMCDARTGQVLFEWSEEMPLNSSDIDPILFRARGVRFSPDGAWCAYSVGSSVGSTALPRSLRVRESATGRIVVLAPSVVQRFAQIAFIPSEKSLLVADVGNSLTTTLTEWSLVTGKMTRASPPISGVVTALDVSLDGGWLGLAIDDRQLSIQGLGGAGLGSQVWLLTRSPVPESALCHGPTIGSVSPGSHPQLVYDPQGRHVAVLDRRELCVWKLDAQRPLFTVHLSQPGGGQLPPIAYSLDGNLLAVARPQGRVLLLDANTGAEKATLATPPTTPTASRANRELGTYEVLQFAPDGKSLWGATAGDITVVRWDLAARESRTFYPALAGQDQRATIVALSRDCRRLLAYSARGSEGLKGWDLATGREVVSHRIPVMDKPIGTPIWPILSDDGEYLACYGQVYRWDGPPEPVYSYTRGSRFPDGRRNRLAFGPRNRIVSVGAEGTMRLADAATGQELLVLEGLPRDVFAFGFCGDGRSLIALGTALSEARNKPLGYPLAARVWRSLPSRMPLTCRLPSWSPLVRCRSVAFHPDGKRVASRHSDGGMSVWSAETGDILASLPAGGWDSSPMFPMMRMAFSPDGERLYANGIKGICVFDARTLRAAQPVVLPNDPAYGVAAMSLSPDGRFVAGAVHNNVGAGMKNAVVVCDAVTGQSLGMLGHPDVNPNRIGRNGTYPTWVTAVAFSPDGKRVLTASRQYLSPMEWTPSRVALWDRASGKQVAHWEPARAGENRGRALPLDGTALPAAAIAFSPRGDRIVATGDFGQVWILDAQSLAAARQWTAHDSTVFAVAVDRDGRRLATAGQDQTIRIWDLGTGARLAVLPGHSGAVYDLAFSPDGRRLASAAADGTVKIWNWAAFLPQAEPASLKQSESGLPSLLPRVVKGD